MESWAEISGRSLSCRPGARWELEQVSLFIISLYLYHILKSENIWNLVCDWLSVYTCVRTPFSSNHLGPKAAKILVSLKGPKIILGFHFFLMWTTYSRQSIKRTVRPPSMVPLYKAQKVRPVKKNIFFLDYELCSQSCVCSWTYKFKGTRMTSYAGWFELGSTGFGKGPSTTCSPGGFQKRWHVHDPQSDLLLCKIFFPMNHVHTIKICFSVGPGATQSRTTTQILTPKTCEHIALQTNV